MRKLICLTVVAAITILAAAPASATPPAPVTALFLPGSMTLVNTHTADGNTFATYSRTGLMSGTFVGETTDILTLVLYANGKTNIHIAGTCACTVAGRSGTFDYVVAGSGIFPTSAEGNYAAFHGTGGLAGLHAEGRFTGDFTIVHLGGLYHFD